MRLLVLAVAEMLLATQTLAVAAQPPSVVTLQSSAGRHQLLRNGEPYTIKGVGGTAHLDLLAKLGGNSLRTWSADDLDNTLDLASRHGLTVCVGLWLGHERHGFDYQEESAVTKQLEGCKQIVRRFKSHPAVLLWAIGNEMEGDGANPAVWYAVNHIARECKKIDPHHPMMTVVAEPCDRKVQAIEHFCPDIDVIGINSYGSIASLGQRYRAAGGTKPYVVTEHGPPGPWEIPTTSWDAPLEPSSSAKAESYASGYRAAVAGQADLCLGSYVFLWGHKQETTATWFGMLLPDGSRLAAADTMANLWSGRQLRNTCPVIEKLEVDTQSPLQPGQEVAARVIASDAQGDPLSFEWVLRSDAQIIGMGGDAQNDEAEFPTAVVADADKATVVLPAGGGGYRLFAYVRDGQGGAAVANVPVFVDAPIIPQAAPRADLPLVVYGDDIEDLPYHPSGYMGYTEAITLDLQCDESPRSGRTCLRVDYNAPDQWGGVLWQSPPNDWEGTQPGGWNLSAAKELEFWARGAEGGETVNFVVGVIDGNQPYVDTAKAELNNLQLKTHWQKFRIPLDGRDRTRIKTGFGWSLAGQGKTVTFYLDDIRYVD